MSQHPSVRAILSSFVLVASAPGLAWLVWIAPSGDKASDARHVLWFVTVAVGCVVAGALVSLRMVVFAGLWIVAVVAAVVTLYLWWSSVDLSGLFVVGIIIATPLMFMAAPLLLLIGGAIGHAAGRGDREPVS